MQLLDVLMALNGGFVVPTELRAQLYRLTREPLLDRCGSWRRRLRGLVQLGLRRRRADDELIGRSVGIGCVQEPEHRLRHRVEAGDELGVARIVSDASDDGRAVIPLGEERERGLLPEKAQVRRVEQPFGLRGESAAAHLEHNRRMRDVGQGREKESAGLEHATELADERPGIHEVLQHVGRQDDVERLCRKSTAGEQLRDVAHVDVVAAGARHLGGGRVDLDAGDAASLALERDRERPGGAPHVEDERSLRDLLEEGGPRRARGGGHRLGAVVRQRARRRHRWVGTPTTRKPMDAPRRTARIPDQLGDSAAPCISFPLTSLRASSRRDAGAPGRWRRLRGSAM